MGLWDGETCGSDGGRAGIADCASGTTSFATAAVALAPTFVEITSANFTAGANNENFTHSNGRLTYTGDAPATFLVTGQVTGVFATDANTTAILGILRNGGIVDLDTVGSRFFDNVAGGAQHQVTTRCTVRLTPGDYVSLGLARGSAAGGNQTVTVNEAALTVS